MSLKRLAYLSAALLVPAIAQAGEPSELVRSFYIPEVISGMEADVRDRFTQPAVGIFEKNDAIADAGDGACLDFAPSIDGQDYDDAEIVRTLELDEAVDGDQATVTAAFSLFPGGDPEAGRLMVWSLMKVSGAWKVADITSETSNWTLSELGCESLADAPRGASSEA